MIIMRKSEVNALFRELRSLFIIMECTLGRLCCHFHPESVIGYVGFDESHPNAILALVISVATRLSEAAAYEGPDEGI
jgi:hypothetical protein